MTGTSDFENMERDGWSNPSIAKGYADGFEMATHLVAEKLAESVGAKPNVEVLDLCTGHGVVAKELVTRGAKVTGLDFSEPMISLAKSSVPNATFVQGDAMATGFPNESFDAVTIGFGVPHFPDARRGLIEAARVLKTGGKIAFSIWHGKGSNGSFGWLFDAVERLADPLITLPAGPDAHVLVDFEVAKAMVEGAGFTDVKLIEIASELRLQSPEALFDLFDGGAVRTASLLSRQPTSKRDAIRSDLALRTRTEGTKQEQGYFVPAPSVVISAVRI
ncbi:methyltransferase domain-containing protein [Roseobacter sp. N2S]|uniref:class I SAM-dependent methyltransferase n=1 Tax=Roseobacter sp. N2S TaxID=2663844 RepID=UPI0028563D4C|nr:methyltransferase domain-containing protein [Roseobacter sp. N2S]MDR6263511.1 SAM-dependent methyltransferase [Roseobacter sp. N2S]